MSSIEALARWQASIGNKPEQPAAVPPTRQQQPPKAVAPMGSAAANALEWRNKTVLLVDSNLRSRESRAKVMRNKGVHVDCVGTADAARVRLAADKYNLILVDLGRDTALAEALVQDIRSKDSRQLVGFLVGSPLFVAKSLNDCNAKAQAPAAPAIVSRPESPGRSA